MLVSLLLAFAGLGSCLSTFSPARPPSIPLAVRNPYMSTWLNAGTDGGDGGYLAGEWPSFWNGAITGWAGLIKVDSVNYIWMGAPNVSASLVTQESFEYTSTRSIFTMNVNGAVRMVIEFLSPVTPDDMKRMSFPVSYLTVEVSSLDGLSHSVQLYTDVTGEWTSGDRSSTVQWNYGNTAPPAKRLRMREALKERVSGEDERAMAAGRFDDFGKFDKERRQASTFTTYATATAYTGYTTAVAHTQRPLASDFVAHHYPPAPAAPTAIPAQKPFPKNPSPGGIAYHRFYREQQLQFSEFSDQTQYGQWFYATDNVAQLSYQSGADVDVRGQFIGSGYLKNTQDLDYRAITDRYPTFGFSNNLGTVSANTPKNVTYTMNLAQPEVIRFEGALGNQTLDGTWTTYFSNAVNAVSFFYNDYPTVSGITTTLDNQISSASIAAAGQNYATITTLAVRQVFGALQLAEYNGSPTLFLKEISSDGNVNTADIMFPLHPIALYLNPTLLKMMLDPVFIQQEAGYWPKEFAIHDIGAAYPNATGHNDGQAEDQPLEECGNMIIMTLAYAQRAHDTAYLSQHYSILRQWNTYLIKEALIPKNQISTDDFAGALANQTNLAIKGIIGIAAMAEIASLTGHPKDAKRFSAIAKSYITQWQTLGTAQDASPPHTTLGYNLNSTYSLLYNLYSDRELGLGLVPQSVYDMQSAFYPTVMGEFGVPLDTRHDYTKGDWESLVAAIASDSTRDMFFEKLAGFVTGTPTNLPFTDLYQVPNGNYPVDPSIFFIARPVVGGHFALLALQSAPSPP